MRRHRGPWAITFARPHGTSEPPAHTRTRARAMPTRLSPFRSSVASAFRARSASRAPQRSASVHSHDPRRTRRSCASRRSPGARPPSRSGACPRRPRRARARRATEARRPVDPAAARGERRTRRGGLRDARRLRSGESLRVRGRRRRRRRGGRGLGSVEEMDEEHGDSEDDAHDPVSVYVRYATRGPARTPDASPGVCLTKPRVGRTNRRVFSRVRPVTRRPASNKRALSEKSKKYPSFFPPISFERRASRTLV